MIAGLGLLDRISSLPFADGAAAAPSPAASGVTSFAAALATGVERTVGQLQSAESLSLNALGGKDISAREVVDAVMSAEQSLQAAIAIRDKIVSAYLEVSRMAI